MSGRRLILRAGLAASLVLYIGCQEPPERRRDRRTPQVPSTAGIARDFRCESSQLTVTSGKPTARLCDRSNRPRPALRISPEIVYHNGRRSRFATPGGSKRERQGRDLTSQVAVDG